MAANMGPNVTLEQFATWRTDSWELVSSKRTVEEDIDVYCVVEWRDVREFCSFEEIAAGTRDPTQGRGNVQATTTATFGIICPPMIVTHRTKRLVAGRGGERDPWRSARLERVHVKYHVGIVHEYGNSVTLDLNYPDSPDEPHPTL
eukprot:CAMPEP_0117649566 /NCGR_PEP_ID=MMETSP0804-20121206/1044_1 /TAXON_ID=1074897 /ORGANISM="Tetraselmis astigmatica, Strain CCMP880" /LENGTH=145 /DNA_ID=CAMNT_0005455319 /DNA_START=614 /DNA_END=1051 /DNA_ORIENTATION=+